MRRRIRPAAFALPIVWLACVVCFQNCDAGFQFDPTTGQLGSTSEINPYTGPFVLRLFTSSGAELPGNFNVSQNVPYLVRATGEQLASGVLTWTLGSDSTATCTLTSAGNLLIRELSCSSVGQVKIQARLVLKDGSMIDANFERTVIPGDPGGGGGGGGDTSDPNRVVFRIGAGTGTGPWNTQSNAVLVFVGQTLRIYNDDTVNHRLVTPGQPCAPQAAASPPGGYYDCAVSSEHSGMATDLYDADAGASAVFYVTAIDGATQYNRKFNVGGVMQSCADCHGSLASSTKVGASFTNIRSAIANNSGGMGAITLTDEEIEAISYVLSN